MAPVAAAASDPGTPGPPRAAHVHNRITGTVFTIISMACMMILAYMLGTRARHLHLNNLSHMNFARKVVVLMYVFGVLFIGATAILQSGLGLLSHADCYAAIAVCLVFYLGSKVLLYLFLVERAHVIRAPHKSRLADGVWLVSIAFVALGFGAIAAIAFVWPIASLSPADATCRIGLLPRATGPIVAYDLAINIGFTSLFVRLLWPLLSFHRERASSSLGGGGGGGSSSSSSSSQGRWAGRLFRGKQQQPGMEIRVMAANICVDVSNERVMRKLKKLVVKTVVGGLMTMLPTLVNLVVLFYMDGQEQGWLCFTICSLDVTWTIIVIHWLTVEPADLDCPPVEAPAAASPANTTTAPLPGLASASPRSRHSYLVTRTSSYLESGGLSPDSKRLTFCVSCDGKESALEAPPGSVRISTNISQSSQHRDELDGAAGSLGGRRERAKSEGSVLRH